MIEQLNLRLEPALPRPGDVAPMWPTSRPDPFDSPDYLFEPTWGGHRVLAFVGPSERPGDGEVRIVDPTRSRPVRPPAGARRARRAGRRALGRARRRAGGGRREGAGRRRRAPRPAERQAGPARRLPRVRRPPPRRQVAAEHAPPQAPGRAPARAPARRRGGGGPGDRRARVARSTPRSPPRGSPASSHAAGRARICRGCTARCGARSRPGRGARARRRPAASRARRDAAMDDIEGATGIAPVLALFRRLPFEEDAAE